MNKFPVISEIVREINRLSYARLIKDAKVIGIDISKVKIPDKINSHLLSARLRQIFKVVLGDDITIEKNRSTYSWFVNVVVLDQLVNDDSNGFYNHLKSHPSIKGLLGVNDSMNSLYSRNFKVLTRNRTGDKEYLLYSPEFIKDIKEFHNQIEMLKNLIPSIRKEYIDKQSEIKNSIQDKYNRIASKRKAGEKE